MSYAQAAGPGTQSNSQHGPQSDEGFYNKNMVVCFGTGISFDSLAEALNKEGYWSNVIGYQKVDFNRRFAVVFKSVQKMDHLIENGINVAGVHVNSAYHRKKEDPSIRVYVSLLPIGINLGEIYEVFKFYGIVKGINKIEKVIQGRKVDTGDRVIIFAKIFRNIPSYIRVC